MALITAVCLSTAVNIQLAIQLYCFDKKIQKLRKEVHKRDKIIEKQEEKIYKLPYS
ncbi:MULTISPECIES: hypothetical protein [unclassified Bartonella]|uniref:hypothetical protein n=1 Tax=unclassified Bartonella TaxID=2645622 RepID=UPI0020C477A1|nr:MULTISPECIES: hypothetical protein [unclassified Bartonella]